MSTYINKHSKASDCSDQHNVEQHAIGIVFKDPKNKSTYQGQSNSPNQNAQRKSVHMESMGILFRYRNSVFITRCTNNSKKSDDTHHHSKYSDIFRRIKSGNEWGK